MVVWVALGKIWSCVHLSYLLLKLKICIFLKGIGALVDVHGWNCSERCGVCWLFKNIDISACVPSRVDFVEYEAQWLLMPPSLCSHLLSTAQLGFTFLILFLMSKSFSWPAPHISCLAVYSWWVWVLLWQRFLWSSSWHGAQVDYSNRPCYRLLFFLS